MRKSKIKGIIGIVVMAVALAAMYFWLVYGQAAISTKTVPIASMDIEQGTIIIPEIHFTLKRISNDELITGCLNESDLTRLNGLSANQYIAKNAQVNDRCFDKPGIVVTNDRFVFKIPTSWIYAVPSSIRRGDDILIYEVDARIDQSISQSIVNNSEGLPTYQSRPVINVGSDKPVLEATVIYVKDSSNREVVDVDGRKRLDGTSQVSSIELVSTSEDIKKLEQKVIEGKKFILVYR